jgi:hypothetical protein
MCTASNFGYVKTQAGIRTRYWSLLCDIDEDWLDLPNHGRPWKTDLIFHGLRNNGRPWKTDLIFHGLRNHGRPWKTDLICHGLRKQKAVHTETSCLESGGRNDSGRQARVLRAHNNRLWTLIAETSGKKDSTVITAGTSCSASVHCCLKFQLVSTECSGRPRDPSPRTVSGGCRWEVPASEQGHFLVKVVFTRTYEAVTFLFLPLVRGIFSFLIFGAVSGFERWSLWMLKLSLWVGSIKTDFKFGRPPLKFSGQSSWLQIQRSALDSRHYQTFWEVVGVERGPLSLVSTTEELLGRKSSVSGLEIRE